MAHFGKVKEDFLAIEEDIYLFELQVFGLRNRIKVSARLEVRVMKMLTSG